MAIAKITIATVLTIAIIGAGLFALAGLTAYRTIPSTGNVKTSGINVYWNSACTNETTSIIWGALNPNSSKSYTVYVKNNGTVPLTLSMTTSNWNPASVASYIDLSWNCTGYILSQSSVTAAHLTLTVSPSATGFTNFSFDITMTGSE
jgi:hypothetical protein